eukprot:3777132-Prymnesium_polylepis.1
MHCWYVWYTVCVSVARAAQSSSATVVKGTSRKHGHWTWFESDVPEASAERRRIWHDVDMVPMMAKSVAWAHCARGWPGGIVG